MEDRTDHHAHKPRADWKENPSNTVMFLVVVIAPLALLLLTVLAVFLYIIM